MLLKSNECQPSDRNGTQSLNYLQAHDCWIRVSTLYVHGPVSFYFKASSICQRNTMANSPFYSVQFKG